MILLTLFSFVLSIPGIVRDAALVGNRLTHVAPFSSAVENIDWHSLETYQRQHKRLTSAQLNTVAEFLQPYIGNTMAGHSRSTVNSSTPPHIEVDCASRTYASVLTGRRRVVPARIIDFVPFNAELQTLELRLYELNDTVDEHVLLEGMLTHRGYHKPLYFQENRKYFTSFLHKITHVVADELDQRRLIELHGDAVWKIEHQMRSLPWKKYEANFGLIPGDTLILHGDCDEIPSREAMLHAKYCELRKTPLVFQLDFYIFSFNWLFQHRVLKYPMLFKRSDLPQTATALLRSVNPFPTMPPHSGAHLNRFIYTLVDKLFKEAAMAEDGKINFKPFRDGIIDEARWLIHGKWNNYDAFSTQSMDVHIPWFALQNKERYQWLFMPVAQVRAIAQHFGYRP